MREDALESKNSILDLEPGTKKKQALLFGTVDQIISEDDELEDSDGVTDPRMPHTLRAAATEQSPKIKSGHRSNAKKRKTRPAGGSGRQHPALSPS